MFTARFNDNSDIDILISFNAMPIENYADNHLRLQAALQSLFGREIDFVDGKAICNQVDCTKVQVYG